MEKPNDIIKTGEYVEPNTFENDSEAVLFYAYLELQNYVEYLESTGITHHIPNNPTINQPIIK